MHSRVYNYSGWKRVKIPTETPLQATVKIPNDWAFIVEDGWIKLIDETTNETKAMQMYQGTWETERQSDGTFISNWNDLKKNDELVCVIDEKDLDNSVSQIELLL